MSTISSKTKVLVCPYCGDTQAAGEVCRACGGLFEPLSRQASHNAMGPWFLRDEKRPFQPGASYETIVKLIERGLIDKYTILRGPTTKQFWTVARRVPGIAHLLGYCHNCDATVGKDDHGCPVCGVPFGAYLDRNYLGLPDVKPLPWEAPAIDDGRGGGRPAFTPLPTATGTGGNLLADARRAAEPLGLSSFASDAELRGLSPRAPHAASAAPVPPGMAGSDGLPGNHDRHGYSSAPTAGHSTGESPRPMLLESGASSIAARSMQRRLQQQQRTIRLLMAMMGLILVASIIVIAMMIMRMADRQSVPQGASTPSSTQPALPAGASHAAAANGAQTNNPAEPLEHAMPSATGPAADDDDSVAAPPVEAATDSPIEVDHDRATALVAEARKESRPLKERIRDAEEAVGLLKSIKARAATGEAPASLDHEIVEAERLLERLKLQEFFP